MRHWYSNTDIMVLPEQLWEFAWSAPMRDLATKVGMSDVGLKKLLSSWGVVTPPQGYWNKVHAGRAVPVRPKPPERRPGESGCIRLDKRFRDFLPSAPPLPACGPFASKFVPEDLDELLTQELKAIGKVRAPSNMDRCHHGLNRLLQREEKRRHKLVDSPYHWDPPKFDNPVDQRRLRILNGVFLALAKRGHEGSADEYEGELNASAMVGDTYISISLQIAGRPKTVVVSGYHRPDPNLPASTALFLTVGSGRGRAPTACWQDDGSGKLEARIAEIAAGIIVAGEAKFRQGLREEEERLEQQKAADERGRRERLAALNAKRIEDLKASGELLRQSEAIRALVVQVKAAAGDTADAELIVQWERWASAEADKLDPVKSGQINTHLRPPSLKEDY
jgi:hypothetical protein